MGALIAVSCSAGRNILIEVFVKGGPVEVTVK